MVRDGRVALVERRRAGLHYWVVPGGGVEEGETIEGAALREAEEELGVAVALGPLRATIEHLEADGSTQRQHYFAATIDDEQIRMTGPETSAPVERGTYTAVWVEIADLDVERVLPRSVARLIQRHTTEPWPEVPCDIDERR